ncbi:CHAT domain-containing protein [Streptomyces sp. NPDC046881]|uniref:CHAT domain-containing protein n=1 Tax=Streptomyces sp. NPDC046881 TaxID=3155374 RepID=UPI0033F691D1
MPFDDRLVQRATEAVTAYEQARARPEPSAVQRALALAEALYAQVPAEYPGQAAIAAYLVSALLLLRAEAGGGMRVRADLDRALDHAEQAVRLRERTVDPDPGLPSVAQFLAHTSEVRRIRLRATGDVRELDAAIDAARAAVRQPGTTGPDHAHVLTTLCRLLTDRHLLTGALADLDEAVQAGRDAVTAAGPAHTSYSLACNNLALALRNRSERRGEAADLGEAVVHARNGAAAAPDGALRAACLSTLGGVLARQYDVQGDPHALDESITAGLAALEALGVPSPTASPDPDEADAAGPPAGGAADAASVLANLALALRRRHERTGDVGDLDTAVAAARAALRVSPPRGPDHPACLDQLANALQWRFQLTGDAEDLNEAVDAGCKALRRCPAGHPARAILLNNHARALRLRFERGGDPADLNQAIAAVRQGLATVPPGDAGHAVCHAQLSVLSLARHGLAADPVDLDTAVAAAAQAVTAAAPGDPHRGLYLNDLGIAHQERFAERADPADIDAAIRAARQAVSVTPRGHPLYATCRENLGNTLITRWAWRLKEDDDGERRRGPGQAQARKPADLADLNEAIAAHRAALDAAVGAAERVMCSANLGTSLRWRYQQTGSSRDAREAEALLRAAVRAGPEDSFVYGRHLDALGWLLSARWQRTGDRDGAAEAVALWQRAARLPGAAAAERVAAATSWGGLAAELGDWAQAMDGMATAVDLLPLVAWRGLDRRQRERLLADCAGLAQNAAAAALAAGRPEQAVELLERGRSVLWSQLLEQHAELDALRTAAPALAARLDRVRAALDATVAATPALSVMEAAAGTTAPARPAWLERHDAADGRTAPAHEWEELIAEVRRLPGFGDFLRRPPLRELQSKLPGPVVLVNVSELGCDALVVTPDAVRVVPLPGLTARDAHARVDQFLTVLQETDRAGGADVRAVRMIRESTLRDILEWLWETVAAPVLDALRLTSAVPAGGPWRRLWWCPTGPLALLPLHAAGRAGDSVLDRVISSYTPTLRSLAPAPGRAGRSAHGSGLLAVAVADAPGLPVLRGVRQEAEAVTRFFPGRFRRLLDGPEATRDAVRTGLAGHAWAHIACHGSQDLSAPSRAGLHLHDGVLTLAELATARRADPGELAYLSACETAMGGANVPDEAVTLAHALQFTGYRHVVATLWSVEDTVATRTAEAFYTGLARTAVPDPARTAGPDPARAAEALHHAVRALRARMPHAPGRWASHIHVGA